MQEFGCAARSLRSHWVSRRGRSAAADRRAVGVQRDQVPAADVVAVVAGRGRATAEVAVVAGRAGRVVLVVSRDRIRDVLHASPGRVVVRVEVRELAVLVLDVAERKHGGEALIDQQIRRELLAARRGRRRARGARDVARGGDHGARRRRIGHRRRRVGHRLARSLAVRRRDLVAQRRAEIVGRDACRSCAGGVRDRRRTRSPCESQRTPLVLRSRCSAFPSTSRGSP